MSFFFFSLLPRRPPYPISLSGGVPSGGRRIHPPWWRGTRRSEGPAHGDGPPGGAGAPPMAARLMVERGPHPWQRTSPRRGGPAPGGRLTPAARRDLGEGVEQGRGDEISRRIGSAGRRPASSSSSRAAWLCGSSLPVPRRRTPLARRSNPSGGGGALASSSSTLPARAEQGRAEQRAQRATSVGGSIISGMARGPAR